jgi:hypothetical protein
MIRVGLPGGSGPSRSTARTRMVVVPSTAVGTMSPGRRCPRSTCTSAWTAARVAATCGSLRPSDDNQ